MTRQELTVWINGSPILIDIQWEGWLEITKNERDQVVFNNLCPFKVYEYSWDLAHIEGL